MKKILSASTSHVHANQNAEFSTGRASTGPVMALNADTRSAMAGNFLQTALMHYSHSTARDLSTDRKQWTAAIKDLDTAIAHFENTLKLTGTVAPFEETYYDALLKRGIIGIGDGFRFGFVEETIKQYLADIKKVFKLNPQFIDRYKDLKIKNLLNNSFSLVLFCSITNDIELLDTLIKAGATLKGKPGIDLIKNAFAWGRLDIIRKIEKEVDRDVIPFQGISLASSMASYAGEDSECFQFFEAFIKKYNLNIETLVNIPNGYRPPKGLVTPLARAIHEGNLNMVQLFINAGANVKFLTEEGKNLLWMVDFSHIMGYKKRHVIEICEILLKGGVDPNQKVIKHTPVTMALWTHGDCLYSPPQQQFQAEYESNIINLIGMLVQHGGNTNMKLDKNGTVLAQHKPNFQKVPLYYKFLKCICHDPQNASLRGAQITQRYDEIKKSEECVIS